MDTVGSPPVDAELHLLPDLGDLTGRAPRREAGIFSVIAHVVLIIGVSLLPPPSSLRPAAEPVTTPRITPLIAPPDILTQRTPNPGKASKEFRGAIEAPRVRVPAPPAPPPAPTRTPPKQAVIPPAPAPTPVQPPAAPPPPPVTAPETKKAETPQLPVPVAPPPQIVAEEKPRNPFERPGSPHTLPPGAQPTIPIPDPGAPIRGGAPGGAAGSQGASPGSIQIGQGGSLELPALLSDPQGVDFKPYLTRLLATVKRNWMAVWPESAKTGRRGRVGVQFSVAKDGTVTKVVWAFQSGADALDRAAVAAISMSNPFPPLPGEFKGDRIVLQFNFAYNIPKP